MGQLKQCNLEHICVKKNFELMKYFEFYGFPGVRDLELRKVGISCFVPSETTSP